MHQSIAQAIRDHGIDTLFGLVGDANLFMANHFVRGCGGKMVPAAHEGGTVLMAQAYAQVTGKVGVATVTSGGGGATVSGCPPHPINIPATTTAVKARHPNPRTDPIFFMFITGDSPRSMEQTSRFTQDFGATHSTPPEFPDGNLLGLLLVWSL